MTKVQKLEQEVRQLSPCELESSVTWYQRAISLNPDSADLRIECARILEELGRRADALDELAKSKEISAHPFLAQIIDVLSRKASGDLGSAIESLKRMISDHGTPWDSAVMMPEDAHFMLAGFQREDGDLDGALACLEAALKRNPTELRFLHDLAMEYVDQGARLEDALDLINRALKIQPSNPVFLSTKGSVLSKMHRREEARAVLEKCLELLPDNEEIRDQYRAIRD